MLVGFGLLHFCLDVVVHESRLAREPGLAGCRADLFSLRAFVANTGAPKEVAVIRRFGRRFGNRVSDKDSHVSLGVRFSGRWICVGATHAGREGRVVARVHVTITFPSALGPIHRCAIACARSIYDWRQRAFELRLVREPYESLHPLAGWATRQRHTGAYDTPIYIASVYEFTTPIGGRTTCPILRTGEGVPRISSATTTLGSGWN